MVHDRFTDIAQIINLKIPLNSRGLITFPAKSDIEDYDLLKGGNLYPPNIRMCTNIRCIAWILDFTPYNELEFTSWLHLVTQSFVIGVGSPLSRKFVMMAKSFLFVSPTHKPRPQLNSTLCVSPRLLQRFFSNVINQEGSGNIQIRPLLVAQHHPFLSPSPCQLRHTTHYGLGLGSSRPEYFALSQQHYW